MTSDLPKDSPGSMPRGGGHESALSCVSPVEPYERALLYVDDHPLLSGAFRYGLRDRIRLEVLSDPDQAAAWIEGASERWCGFVIDLRLRAAHDDETGLELLGLAYRLGFRVPSMLVSAREDFDLPNRARLVGADYQPRARLSRGAMIRFCDEVVRMENVSEERATRSVDAFCAEHAISSTWALKDVLCKFARGFSVDEIARLRGRSVETVRHQLAVATKAKGLCLEELRYALGVPSVEASPRTSTSAPASAAVSVEPSMVGDSTTDLAAADLSMGARSARVESVEAEQLRTALASLAVHLRAAELEVLAAGVKGHGIKDIAALRGTDPQTVRTQAREVARKLKVPSFPSACLLVLARVAGLR